MISYILTGKQLNELGIESFDASDETKYIIMADKENPGWPKNRIGRVSLVTESGIKIDATNIPVSELEDPG